MRARGRFARFGMAGLALGLSLTLGGCESFDLADIFPDGKKKLPGERRPVFPEGVPGVPQGVPPELMKGYQQQTDPALAGTPGPTAPSSQAAVEEPKPEAKPAPKPAPKPRRAAARPKPVPTVAPEVQQQSNQGGWPQQQPAQASQWPSSPPQQQSAWPQAPAPGTFSQ